MRVKQEIKFVFEREWERKEYTWLILLKIIIWLKYVASQGFIMIIDGSREILKLVVLYNGIIRCINGIPVINTVGLPFRNRALLFNPICSCTHYLKCLILTCSWNLGNTMILLQNYKNFVLSWNQKPPASRCDTWAFDRCPSEQWWPDYKNSPI